MRQDTKTNLLRYIEEIAKYADDGEDNRSGDVHFWKIKPTMPTELVEYITTDCADSPSTKFILLRTPTSRDEFFSVPHEILEALRDDRRHPCAWFFRSRRLCNGQPEDDPCVSPMTKLTILLCSMIVQLSNLVPEIYEDRTGALSAARFNQLDHELQWATKCLGGLCKWINDAFDIDKAINIVKALTMVVPRGTFFIFERCDSIIGPFNDALTAKFADLLAYLANPPEPERAWKTLYIDLGMSLHIYNLKERVIPERFEQIDYPPGYQWHKHWE
ncbi:hypothetical protein F4819DRAFT_506683 [Hypoxylon fuscum]|nr:hypothetical protein F4819DRAFT_506683 [Hypoxylon fuscum]